MSYSITALTDDYYEGTGCLVNKFNIQNEEQLAKLEAGITLAKTAELERNPISDTFDFDHYKQIHKYLFEDFIDNIVDFYCSTNMLHPFREGNGRTQRIFIAQLIRFCGYDINFSEIDTDELMVATIHSANGITDYLKDIFSNHIKR